MAGQTYSFFLEGIVIDGDRVSYTDLELRDADGNSIASSPYAGFSDTSVIQFTATEDGTYYIDAGSSRTWDAGGYRISLFDDYGDTLATATSITPGNVGSPLEIMGISDSATDTDWFSFYVNSGEFVAFNTSTALNITIFTETGVELVSGTTAPSGGFYDDGIMTVGYNFANSGRYYVRVDGLNIHNGVTIDGTYSLSVYEGREAVGGRSISTATDLAIDSPIVASHDYDTDNDYFAFTVEAGFEGRFFISDFAFFNIRDDGGNIIATSDSEDDDLVYMFEEAGTYYVEVPSYAIFSDGQQTLRGGYELTFTSTTDDIPIDTFRTLAIGGSSSATIDFAGDVDRFATDAAAGTIIRFETTAREGFYALASDGTVIDTLIGGTLELQGGSGWTEFASLTGASGLDYTVTAVEVTTDDFVGNQTTTGLVTVGTDTTISIDYDGDADAFRFAADSNEALQFTATGASIAIYDREGNLLGRSTDSLTFIAPETLSSADVASGDFYVLRIVGETAGDITLQSTTRTIDINGTDSNDTLTGTDDAELVVLRGGADRFNGEGGNDIIYGGTGVDRISGGIGDDLIYGEQGYNYLNGDNGDDQIYGGDDGNSVSGGDGDDFIQGGAGRDFLQGNNGNDTLHGGEGRDFLYGQDDDDTLYGDADDDYLSGGNGHDTLRAGDGNDILYGDDGNDIMNSGEGNDFAYGGEGDDRISGNGGDDELFGQAGDDIITGNDGADRIFGGDGNDTLNGGAGRDIMNGNDGNDRLLGGDDTDIIVGANGNDTLFGQGGRDRLIGGAGDDILYGGDDRDVFVAGDGNDSLFGDAGVDYLVGGDGNDTLTGGADSDRLIGGAGDDTLIADLGRDILIGGAGRDRFVVEQSADLAFAADFEDGSDFINFSDFGLSGSTLAEAGITVVQKSSAAHISVNGELVLVLLGTSADDVDFGDFIL